MLPDAGWRSWCNLADPLQFPLTLGADLQADPGQFVFFQGEMSPERKRLSQEGNSLRTVHHQLPLQRSKILSQEQPGEMPYMDAAKDSEETPP